MTCPLKVWSFLSCVLVFAFQCAFSQKENYILTIGDSHGAWETGWVSQLQKLRPNDSILNVAISGNTIGFDNLGKESLNELKNIQHQLTRAERIDLPIDYIVILIGTNDCKAIFDSMQNQVPQNLERLIRIITAFNYQQQKPPKIILATPPPVAQDEKLEAKYHGASKRLIALLPHYKLVADMFHSSFINVHDLLLVDFPSINKDGIHLTEEGYKKIALMINEQIPDKQ